VLFRVSAAFCGLPAGVGHGVQRQGQPGQLRDVRSRGEAVRQHYVACIVAVISKLSNKVINQNVEYSGLLVSGSY